MNPALRLARLDLLTLLCLSIVAAGSQHANGQTPNAPVPDVELKPGTAEAGALFGYTMAAGRVGPTFDTNDDVVVCAIMEDEPGLPPILNAGATYTFNDGPLSLHAAFPRLIPSGALSDDMDMGRLGVAIGDPRGTTASPMENLLLVGAWGRPGRYLACVPPESFPTLGSVEVFNLTLVGSAFVTSIAPPIAPGDCAPFGASGFGHSIAFGNFDGDDYQDVAVGAHKSNGSLGRVYVFFGHAAFTTSPHTSWLGLNAPPIGSTNTFFGCMVAADDLDGDGKDELIVGRSERSIDVGRAYIIDGVWLTSVAGLNNLTTPPASSYQEIVNPQASFANPNDSFGWRVYAVGDVGDGATPGSLDGNRDVAIQGEVSDYDPTEYGVHAPSLPCPLIQNCGALWIYYNDGGTPGGGPPFVQSDPIPIYTPANVGCPQGQLPGQAPGRPGRAAARVEWLRDDDSLGDYLLVSEPERNVVFGGTQRDQAGQVYFIEIPIDQQSAQIDALGPAAFLEVGGPIAGSFFGSDIVTLDYKANPLLFPGQQIVVSSRQWRSGSLAKAGRAYSFTP